MQLELPGLFDLQVNGFAGVDFNNPATTGDDVLRAIEKIRATGVTRFLPTLITSSLERFVKCARTLTAVNHPAIAGLHMEGPYIAAEDGPRGAHSRTHVIDANVDDFRCRQDAADGKIRLVTLSPEVPGAVALIEHLVRNGIRVAIGHTAATTEQIREAIKAGASLSTHLGNGCAQLLPRHPNFIWEQLAADELMASLIVDGHHLPASTVKGMVRAKSPERVILISDATAAAGCPPGQYELSGTVVVLSESGHVSQPGQPWLAGSALRLDQAIVNTVKMTALPFETVWAMGSTQPAKYLGLQPAGQVIVDWDLENFQLLDLKVVE